MRVLMIGPGRNVKGGISTVVNNYYESNIDKIIYLEYVETMKDGNKLYKFTVFIKALIKYIFKFNYDIVHVHMSSRASFYRKSIFILISKLYKKKIIIHMHGSEFDKFYFKESGKNGKRYINHIINKADRVIALSDEWKKFYMQFYPEDKIEVIYNSIKIPEKVNKNYNNINILFMGRLGKRKGIYDLLEVFPELLNKNKNIKVTLCGDGDINEVNEICKEKEINKQVYIAGWLKGKEKERILAQSTIYVLPSYNEGMPMSILEAMSYSMPIISTDVGGINKEVINNENGYLIKPGDKNSLRQKLEILINSEDLRKKMGEKSYNLVRKKFNIENTKLTLKKLYGEVIEEN